MSTTYLESFGADLSENKLFQCLSILLTRMSTACDFLFQQISKIAINGEKIIGKVNKNWLWCMTNELIELAQYTISH